jgi:uncharacterized iron-regulated membrane protein
MKNKLFLGLLCALLAGSFILGGCSWLGRTAGKTQAKIERKAESLEKGYEQGYEQEKAKTE